MQKNEILKDGTRVVVKNLTIEDLDKSVRFFRSLPPEDRKYLRVEVTDAALVEKRIRTAQERSVVRIVALVGDEIVGDGALELAGEGWRKHQGELRTIVSREYQRKGLGLLLMRELYLLAVEKGVEKIVVKMARPQIGARNICRKLGFHEELLIPDYVRDQTGNAQDLLVMICDVKEMWEKLELSYASADWQRCR